MLLEHVKSYKTGNQDSLIHIINLFNPVMKKYNNKYSDDDIMSCFIISLIELLNDIDISNFNYDGEIVNYINRTIINTYIDIIRKKSIISEVAIHDIDYPILDSKNNFDELINNLDFFKMIDCLTSREKFVIHELFKNQQKSIDIAKKLGISKQSLHNVKKRALKKIETGLNKENIWS